MASKTGYFDVVFSPAETMKRDKRSVVDGITRLATFGAIVGAVMGLLAAGALAVAGAVAAAFVPLAFLLAGLGMIAALFAVVALAFSFAVCAVAFNFAETAVFFVCAKLLGGKGNFSRHFYLNALINTTYPLVALIALMAATLLLFIPVLGPAAFAVAFTFLALYCVYLRSLAVKETHGLNWVKSVLAVLLVPVILVLFLASAAAAALLH